ncbi:MAG TPA: rhodanese-like domain-containing protein [Gemmatimonadales bacterium]|nr:rhodanese-like domain-containing protein [Gemmatimonadales bacterium]
MDEPMDDEGAGRWERARRASGGRSWLVPFLVIVVLPILIGTAVVLVLGRGLGFEVVRRRTVHRFPDVQWVTSAELARWREDSSRAQPLVLDARSKVEYQVSHLRDALLDDAGRPSVRPLRGRATGDPIVVYGSVGYRGARLAYWLGRQGFTNVRNLSGGIFQWANEDRPLFRDSRPAAEVHPYDHRWGFLLVSRYRADAPDLQTPFAAP